MTNPDYRGSITIGRELCKKADILEFEKVEVYNCNTGGRFSTYVIFGKKNDICVNGAAARLAQKGDRIILASYAGYEDEECKNHSPLLIQLD